MKPSAGYPGLAYAWYVVGVLIVINILSSVDRQLLALLVVPVRHDLGISDTQISLLQGAAFAIFYALFGIPLGWLADKRNRRNVIVAGVVVWSAMTAACGLANGFWSLFFARIGVGLGEAALLPAAYSMIADYFALQRRGRALSVFSIAQFAGVGVSWGVGGALILFLQAGGRSVPGFLTGLAPWKLVFVAVGAAGIALAPLLLSVREPIRQEVKVPDAEVLGPRPSFLTYLRANKKVFLPVYGVYALMAFVGYNFQAWLPTYFERRYHVPSALAGLRIGIVIAVVGTAGCICSGLLGDLWTARRTMGGRFRVTIIWWAMALVATTGMFLAPSPTINLAFVGLFNFGVALALSSAAATIQDIVPNELRGRATATYLMLLGIVGFGLGPSAVAVVTDYVFHDDAALRVSLILVPTPAIVIGAVLSLVGLKQYQEIFDRVNQRK